MLIGVLSTSIARDIEQNEFIFPHRKGKGAPEGWFPFQFKKHMSRRVMFKDFPLSVVTQNDTSYIDLCSRIPVSYVLYSFSKKAIGRHSSQS